MLDYGRNIEVLIGMSRYSPPRLIIIEPRYTLLILPLGANILLSRTARNLLVLILRLS